ncbi:peroxidase [Salvia divinorum]
MASRIGILILAFLDFTRLFAPVYGFKHPQVYRVPKHQRNLYQTGDDFADLLKPFTGEQHAEPVFPVQEPQPKPVQVQVQEPENEPVQDIENKPARGGLREMFYKQSCPEAEKIVNQTIHKHFQIDPTYAAGFVRLFFHDCYVTGCDASILLDTTPTGEEVEKKARHNGPLVRGYEVVDDIKTELEKVCPGVVSCADILAFATRDSLVYSGVPSYAVVAGRRDARASLAANVEGNLPLPDSTAEDNIRLFQRKGMTLEELVVLVGAHSIGSAHCSVVAGRFHSKEKEKDIDRGYWLKMQTMTVCQSESQDVPFDPYSHHKMDSRFYKELLTNKALIESDHNLAREPRGNSMMKKLVDNQAGWIAKFTNAMKRLGETEVLVGDQGEVRKQCRAVN